MAQIKQIQGNPIFKNSFKALCKFSLFILFTQKKNAS